MTEQSNTKPKGMRPIWYFAGWLLLIIGLIVIGTGLFELVFPPQTKTVLYELHASIWWGGIIAIAGLILSWRTRNMIVE